MNQQGIQTRSMDQNDDGGGRVAKTIFTFSMLVLVVPIAVFFLSKSFVFEGMLSYDSKTSYYYSAIVAVVTVQILLGMFVYVAYSEGDSKPTKQD
ncbi:vacuolar ATPase assembly integral membrane protein VMA21-like [Tubulanus polymorphus]|uniref:vacuolar ATPase assembly integral membrane protein VMA21-like n=1 Tax=Tubulanus polymorphus TaxID=672921 RepID=UPI003DA55073